MNLTVQVESGSVISWKGGDPDEEGPEGAPGTGWAEIMASVGFNLQIRYPDYTMSAGSGRSYADRPVEMRRVLWGEAADSPTTISRSTLLQISGLSMWGACPELTQTTRDSGMWSSITW